MPLSSGEILLLIKKRIKQDVVSIVLQTNGWSSVTHKIVTDKNQTFYFKENSQNKKVELDLTQKLVKLGVPLPEIIAIENDWLLMKSLNGISLKEAIKTDLQIIKKVLPEAGKCTAIINSLSINKFGPLKTVDAGSFDNYFDFYQSLYQQINPRIKTKIANYLNKTTRSYLCHGDMAFSHIYVDKNGKFEALLDIDDMLGANSNYDLAEFDSGNDRNEEYWKLFTDGYKTVLPVPDHNSPDLLIEEYLIMYDSYNYFATEHPEQIERIKQEKNILNNLEKTILISSNIF